MKPAAHAAAAIEILMDIDARRRPVSDTVKDWGLAHRFAGSKDRAAISSLVYDVLRRRASLAWRMGAETPRALVLGCLVFSRGWDAARCAAEFAASPHAPAALDEAERTAFAGGNLEGAPTWVRGDYPEWLDPLLARTFGETRAEEGAALAERAPLDLRVNSLKGNHDKPLEMLSHLKAELMPHSPLGLRVPLLADGRGPPVQAEEAFQKGLIEVQDEGSQLAVLLAAAAPGEQVIDLCAGAGGKTLALAASMANKGQIYAHDTDIRRLAPIHDRLERAGVRNVQVRAPKGKMPVMDDLAGKADLVLVDAPCTGAGTWRRNPDAKWRLRPHALGERQKQQEQVLANAAGMVKPGGRLVYVTCSLLAEENQERISAFRAGHPEFAPIPAATAAIAANLPGLAAKAATADGEAFLLSPRRTGTDGFFVAVLKREA